MPPSMIWEIVIGSFGVTGALVLVGGWIVLRFNRDRQQFQLMQIALEKGITNLPGGVPGWVISLRQGVLALVLGVGVAASGGALAISSGHIEEVPATATAHYDETVASRVQPGGPADLGPGDRGPQDHGPQDRGPDDHGHHGGPPQQDPTMERWHRMETQRLIGLLGICAGGVVALLGVVRMSFARVERRYAQEITAPIGRGSELA